MTATRKAIETAMTRRLGAEKAVARMAEHKGEHWGLCRKCKTKWSGLMANIPQSCPSCGWPGGNNGQGPL